MSEENRSIFGQEWRDCLEAHYRHVVRTDDRVTEPTLHGVLLRVGFSEAEIDEIAIEAKMRDVDAHPDDLPGLHDHAGHDHAPG
jgi:hypothetical protein